MDYKIHNISIDDIEILKKVYNKGVEGRGDDPNNKFNVRMKVGDYNNSLISSEKFFCDLYNTELMDIIKKNIPINSDEYITNVHYINYKEGEGAIGHVDTGASEKTFSILLTDEFEGGEFFLKREHIPFKMCEILQFNGNDFHEIKPVTKGSREVLIVWLKWNNKNQKSLV